jgi:hypothetical protein
MPSFEDNLLSFHAESGGILSIEICRPAQVGQLLGQLMMYGDDSVAPLLRVIRQAFHSPNPDCTTCGRDLKKDQVAAVALIRPDIPNPRHVLACGVCTSCGSADDLTLIAEVAAVLRESVWPELRLVASASSGGRK